MKTRFLQKSFLMSLLIMPIVPLCAQEPDTDQGESRIEQKQSAEVELLKEELLKLSQERDELLKKLQEHEQTLSQEIQQLRQAKDPRLQDPREKFANRVRAEAEEAANASRRIESEALELRKEIEELHLVEESLRKQSLAGDAGTAYQLTNLLTEAWVRNELKRLEAKATLEVLKRIKPEEKRGESNEFGVKKAELLLNLRELELKQVLQKESASGEGSPLSVGERRNDAEIARLKLEEAKLLLEESVAKVEETKTNLDEEISRSAIDLAVAEELRVLLQTELDNAREKVNISSEAEQVSNRRRDLERRAMELERLEMDVKRRWHIETEAQRAELQQQIAVLELDMSQQSQKYGADHPISKKIEAELQLLRQHLDQLMQQKND